MGFWEWSEELLKAHGALGRFLNRQDAKSAKTRQRNFWGWEP